MNSRSPTATLAVPSSRPNTAGGARTQESSVHPARHEPTTAIFTTRWVTPVQDKPAIGGAVDLDRRRFGPDPVTAVAGPIRRLMRTARRSSAQPPDDIDGLP